MHYWFFNFKFFENLGHFWVIFEDLNNLKISTVENLSAEAVSIRRINICENKLTTFVAEWPILIKYDATVSPKRVNLVPIQYFKILTLLIGVFWDRVVPEQEPCN